MTQQNRTQIFSRVTLNTLPAPPSIERHTSQNTAVVCTLILDLLSCQIGEMQATINYEIALYNVSNNEYAVKLPICAAKLIRQHDRGFLK